MTRLPIRDFQRVLKSGVVVPALSGLEAVGINAERTINEKYNENKNDSPRAD